MHPQPSARPRLQRIATLSLAALAVLWVAGCSSPQREPVARGTSETNPQGRTQAPDVVLADLDGETLRLSDHRGKVVLVGFWATWCGPCRREVPHLQALQARYASRGFDIIGLSVDRDDDQGVRDFIREHGMSWPNAVANEAVIASFGSVKVIPTTFIIDRQGNIAHRLVGLQSEGKLRAAIEPLL